MPGAPFKSRHQNFLSLFSFFEGAHQAMDERRREKNMIHRIEHEGGCARNMPQSREKGTELAGSPSAVNNNPRSVRNSFSQFVRVVSQDHDRFKEAGAITGGNFERVFSAESGEGFGKFETRRGARRQENGIDVGSLHRQCETRDYRSPSGASPGIMEYFVSCLNEPENGFRIGSLRSCCTLSPSGRNLTGG